MDTKCSNRTEQIFRTTKAYNITAEYVWVRGHQDKYKNYEKLDTYAQLNVQADHLAGDFEDRKGVFIRLPLSFLAVQL